MTAASAGVLSRVGGCDPLGSAVDALSAVERGELVVRSRGSAWYSARDLVSSAQQSLPNRVNPAADPAVFGSVRGAELTPDGLVMSGESNNHLEGSASANGTYTKVDLFAKLTPDSWSSPSANMALVAAWNGGSSTSFALLRLDGTTGYLNYQWHTGGGSVSTRTHPAALGFAEGVAGYVRVLHDGTSVKFLASDDGLAWIELAEYVESSGVVASSATPWLIGNRAGGTLPLIGTIHEAGLYLDDEGLTVDLGVPRGTQSLEDDQGNTWTLNTSGADTNDPVRVPPPTADGVAFRNATSYVHKNAFVAATDNSAIEYICRFTPWELGAQQYLCGTSSTHQQVVLDGDQLWINAFNDDTSRIGGAISESIPALAPGRATWLRFKLTAVGGVCEYWYSDDQVDDVDEVTWVPLAIETAGVVPATETIRLIYANQMLVGTHSTGIASSVSGIMHYCSQQWGADPLRAWVPDDETFDYQNVVEVSQGGGLALFDGTDDRIQLPVGASTPNITATTGQHTRALLLRCDALQGNDRLFELGSGTDTAIGLFVDAGHFYMRVEGDVAVANKSTTGEFTPGEWVVGFAEYDEGLANVWTSSHGYVTGYLDYTGVGTLVAFEKDFIGATVNGTGAAAFELAEVLDLPTILAESEKQAVSAYLLEVAA